MRSYKKSYKKSFKKEENDEGSVRHTKVVLVRSLKNVNIILSTIFSVILTVCMFNLDFQLKTKNISGPYIHVVNHLA